MPRHNRRRIDPPPQGGRPAPAAQRYEEWRGERYVVRMLSAGASGKAYRCPGCDQTIQAGVPHVVAWPDGDAEAGDRRHWHSSCWTARDRRAPGTQRSRSAPRY